MFPFPDFSLYFVSGEIYSKGRSTFEVAEKAVLAGIDLLQMREKNKTFAESVSLGRQLAALCQKHKTLFIVNDNPFLSQETGADGVHLGQEDLQKFPLSKTRQIVGKNKIIGISTHSVKQFSEANESDFDYIAFGPIFSTKTKNYQIGLAETPQIMRIAKKPVVFIGGIDLNNLTLITAAGGKNIAVIRAICEAEQITQKVFELKQKLLESKRKT